MIETRMSLLERVRDPADSEAWSEFVTMYHPLLTAYLRKRGVGESDAADLVQMVLTRLITALSQLRLDRQKGRFRTWLWQVTHSTLTDWHRRRVTRQKAEQRWIAQQSEAADDDPDSDWKHLYHQRVLEVVLQQIAQSAPVVSWNCFKGRVLDGRPAAEIAEALGISVNSVYINSSRLLTRVREACAEYEETLQQP